MIPGRRFKGSKAFVDGDRSNIRGGLGGDGSNFGLFDGGGARRRSSIVLSFPFGIQRSVRLEGNVLAGGGRNVSATGRIGVLQSCSC